MGIAETQIGSAMEDWAHRLRPFRRPGMAPLTPLRSVEPSPALPLGAAETLTQQQVRAWREEGWALVRGIWPEELIGRAVAELTIAFPPP